MRCLWLTLADPDPPTNGQFLYSRGLIQATAAAGARLDVLALTRPGAARTDGAREDHIRWWIGAHRPRSRWACLASLFPQMAARTRTAEMRRKLRALLAKANWDAVIFDNLTTGWALRPVLARWPEARHRPKLVYIAHNHEESVAAKLVATEASWPKRQIKRLDAAKVAWLERALIRHADLLASNAPEDCARFAACWPGKRVEFLAPGYSGPRVPARCIDTTLPRRAIIVGSFDWQLKRANLEEFLGAADPLFAAAGIELLVVGNAEESFLARLRRTTTATRFTGRVDDVAGFLETARIAVVPERVGGGFKLKVLDYVFARVPIVALAGSIPGVPLHDGDSVVLCADQAALARGVVRLIDDFVTLNRLQERAYLACRDTFDWESRGRNLLAAITGLAATPQTEAIPVPGNGAAIAP
ncbi:MAG TPA: glycosyltransferase [Alphaproteobacteria bacterium]|nr:glycosyltransferase [Alphaproteobacteria bacterium]